MKTLENLKGFEILSKSMQQVVGGREVSFERVDGLCLKVIEKKGEIVKMKHKDRYESKCG